MRRILDIDPGSRLTGYGIIEESASGFQYIASVSISAVGLNVMMPNISEAFSAVRQWDGLLLPIGLEVPG